MQALNEIFATIDGHIGGSAWFVYLLIGTGLFFTFYLKFPQIRYFRHAFFCVTGKYDEKGAPGDTSHFRALTTALSGTVGTGNIAGVATAISLGGPGALFWMWVTAFFGMATKFTECTLALNFRRVGAGGEIAGGPMYTLLHGLNMKRAATLFAASALVASFGIGNMVQANSVVDGLGYLFPQVRDNAWLAGTVMALLVGMVILGGVTRIARVASAIVPFMALLYIGAAVLVLINHIEAIPQAFATILNHALNPWAVGGAAVGEAIRWGVARGLFSNEAGLGSSPMAHAAARTNEPVREGLVAMMEPFIDTLVICTMTGLVIVVTGAYSIQQDDLVGAALTAHAFQSSIGVAGAGVVGVGLSLFAFSTMIAWSYYGDRSAYFLFGEGAVRPYRVLFTFLVIIGAAVPLKLVWNIADITNLLMALPNLLSLALLAGLVQRLKNEYFSRSFPIATSEAD